MGEKLKHYNFFKIHILCQWILNRLAKRDIVKAIHVHVYKLTDLRRYLLSNLHWHNLYGITVLKSYLTIFLIETGKETYQKMWNRC